MGAAHLRMAAVLSCWVVGWVVLLGDEDVAHAPAQGVHSADVVSGGGGNMHVFAVTSPWMSALGNAINLAFCHVQPGGSLFLRKGFWGEDFWSLETAAAVVKSRRAAVDFLNVHVARSGQWRTVWCVTSAVRAFAGKRSFSPRGSSPRFRGCASRVDCVRFTTA